MLFSKTEQETSITLMGIADYRNQILMMVVVAVVQTTKSNTIKGVQAHMPHYVVTRFLGLKGIYL